MQNQKYRLGLDLGTNSIGWAMLALDKENRPFKILDLGVRIFSDGRNPKDGTPLAVARREARGARRRRDRFLARKSRLMNYLISLNLMPNNEIERKKLELLNPYQLRAKSLDEALSPFELGRALFHLNQRRGFKSNRKEQAKEEKKPGETKQSQEELAKKIIETNSRTLGEFFYKERFLKGLTTHAKPDESGLYPTRSMYENEFKKIKESQINKQNLSQESWQEIEQIIFFQRPLKPQEKGFCQFINQNKDLPNWAKEILENYKKTKNKNAKGLPRAYLALPSYQKFRILSEINNLKIIENNSQKILLDSFQKKKLIEYLHQKKSANFASLRKQIGFTGDQYRFNFEGDKRDKFIGNETEIELKDPKYFGENWHKFSLTKQDEIVEFLLESHDEEEIYQKALNDWQLNNEQALSIKKITPQNFKSGVGNLSKELLQKLVTEIEQKNCRYDQAIKNLGFHHSQIEALELQNHLDYYGKIIPASTVPVKYGSKEEIDHGKIANPTVHVALNQLRKVINDLIKQNGNPYEIHIELARDLKISKDEKRQIESQQKKKEKENEELKNELKKLGQINNYNNRLKIKLFNELAKDNNGVACCPYSGKTIGITNLFSHEIEIEHILPFSKTYDDSIANKTISYRSHNQIKGNRSPFEAFGEEILARIQNLPNNKKWRFYENAMDKFLDQNQFQERQLNDTRYLSKIAKQYLAQICNPNKIKVTNGKLTALLRHNWGLNSILKHQEIEEFDPETGELLTSKTPTKEQKKKAKNRDDNRHHAIDAIVIALTETRLLQQISRDNARGHDLNRIEINPPQNWQNFQQEVTNSINQIVVSHKPDHGKNNKLHDETYYGIIEKKIDLKRGNNNDEGYNFIYSKPLTSLTENQIDKIRDNKIYYDLKQKLSKAKDKKELENVLKNYQIISQKGLVKVKNIRLVTKENRYSIINHKQKILDQTKTKIIEKIHHKAIVGSNHHITIWQFPKLDFIKLIHLNDKKLTESFSKLTPQEQEKFTKFQEQQQKTNNWLSKDCSYAVSCPSTFEAISDDDEKFKPHPATKLLAKIHGGDLVKIKVNNHEKIVKITKLNPASNRILGVLQNESGSDAKEMSISFGNFAVLELTKVFVSPAGKVFVGDPILKMINNR